MIWFILAIIFGILMVWCIHDEGVGWFTSIAGGLFCGFVGWFLCFILAGAAVSGIGKATNSIKYVEDTDESHTIAAVQDNTYAHGFRNADGRLKITYLYKNVDEDGKENFRNETVDGEDTQIYLDDNVIPHVVAYSPIFVNNIVNTIFGPPIFYNHRYDLYVPTGSLKMEYNIDLQ